MQTAKVCSSRASSSLQGAANNTGLSYNNPWKQLHVFFVDYWVLLSAVLRFSMLCMCGTSHGPVSVFCICVCLSVTSRCSTKTAKHRITQTKPHDSPGTLVFWCQRSPRNSTGFTPYWDAKCRWGACVKIGDFRQVTGYISKMVQDRRMVYIKVE